ncbi:MAG: hypothetical protein IKX86_01105 [Clostridia bacterium]|nr:hypothetical protein [Clostridia bacterium]MBR5767260.1 hypothetical protein [Clostridia bacterium]
MNPVTQAPAGRREKLDSAAKILMEAIENHGFKTTLKEVFEMPLNLRLSFTDTVMSAPIDDFDFSTRVKNSLHRSGRHTISGLVDAVRDGTLKHMRGLGAKCETEIKTALVDLSWSGLSESGRMGFCRELLEHNTIKKGDT